VTRISLPTSALHDLLVPVLPHASVDKTLPVLNAVRIEVANDALLAIATDRYTVAITRRPLDEPHPDAAITIPRREAAAMLRMFPHSRDDDPGLTLDIGDTLRIDSETENRLTIQPVVAEPGELDPGYLGYPRWRKLIGKYLHRDAEGVTGVSLNANFMQRWAAARRYGVPLRFVLGSQPTEPVLVVAGEHFLGMWMPVREQVTETGDWLKGLPWCDEIPLAEPTAGAAA
jgi:hypothetical protein